jgi:DNA (cytosine-5)-methyltransferase 1
VDLFAGAGGLSLGFEQAGFDVKAAVEIDPVHCATHKFNFPDCAVLPYSVGALTADEIREAGGITGPVDCVFGGPPCQGFSLIGHRALEDPRNALVLEFVRLVAELDARTFVFENVKGLTVGTHKVFLDELVAAFDDAGYTVRRPWSVCDTATFGVPQRRERLILIGAKKGTPLPDYPMPTTSPADELQFGLPAGPTCRDALADLPNADGYAALRDTDAVLSLKWGAPSAYARELRCLSNDAWHYGYVRKWKPAVLTSSWRTDHTAISHRRFAQTLPGSVEPISRFFKLAPDGLSNTLRAGTDGPRGAFTSPRPIHYKYPRCITVREMARLHGFPDWFRFHGTKWHGARQVGNAVAPPLARAIAREIGKALGIRPRRPQRVVALGDPVLLTMDMAGASRHFGIPVPATRRDRKSGARKRSQRETEAARLAELEAASG